MTNHVYIKELGKGIIMVSGIDKNECNSLYTKGNLKLIECNWD